jgi:hypothetical protein
MIPQSDSSINQFEQLMRGFGMSANDTNVAFRQQVTRMMLTLLMLISSKKLLIFYFNHKELEFHQQPKNQSLNYHQS